MKRIFFFQILSLHETIALPSWYLINLTQSPPAQKYFYILLSDIQGFISSYIDSTKDACFFLLIRAYTC